MLSDEKIVQQSGLQPITDIASKLSISSADVEPYGKYKAKIPLTIFKKLEKRQKGKLILVTAIHPTPAGIGKTTMTIGLADSLASLGENVAITLREPSLGPIMGQKGSATGGGRAQIAPRDEINLHFTGDIHAISSAHNLLAAIIDNHLHHGNALQIDTRQIFWKRAVDVNDRALRQATIGLGGALHGIPREDGFIITVASEIMAVLCLSHDYQNMTERLSRMVVANNILGQPITVADLKAQGALSVLLKEALKPNLVQTLDNTPCFVHGGPFANIAHGTNSLMALNLSLKCADYTITEAGFGADLGAEKFLDIVCPQLEKQPDAVVLVATIKALKYNGGAAKEELAHENMQALQVGSANLVRHIENLQQYGLSVIVALNRFSTDTREECEFVQALCRDLAAHYVETEVFIKGGANDLNFGKQVLDVLNKDKRSFKPLYSLDCTLQEKILQVATKIYRAKEVQYSKLALNKLKQFTQAGYDRLPVCIAKTPYSFSDNPALLGAPNGFTMHVDDVSLSAGAGFVVIKMGNIMLMPGLPKQPLAENMHLDEEDNICGLS